MPLKDQTYDRTIKTIQMLGLPTVIVVILFWFLGMEVWPFFKDQLKESTIMQKAVTEAIKTQSEAAAENAHINAQVSAQLEQSLKYIISNNELIKESTLNTKHTVELMDRAAELMKDTPQQRTEMVKLLREISDKLTN